MAQFQGTADQIENNQNKVKIVTSESTDTQYPSAKAVYSAISTPLKFTHRQDGNLFILDYLPGNIVVNGKIIRFDTGYITSLSQQNYIYLKPDNALFADPSSTLVEDGTFPDYVLIGYDNGSSSTFWDGDVYKHNKDPEAHQDLRDMSESNRFIYDVDIEFSGSTITSATYKYGAETKDIIEYLSVVPWSTMSGDLYYIRDDGSISPNYSDDSYVYIAKIYLTGSNPSKTIEKIEYLPIDQKTAGPAYEELKGEVGDLTSELSKTNQTVTNALIGSKAGTAVRLDGVSPLPHNPQVEITGATLDGISVVNPVIKAYGKNLAPKIPTQTKNGLTLTQNSDGSVTINGTATGDSSTTFSVSSNVTLPAGATFTFSGCTTGSSSTYRIYVYQPGWQQCFLVGTASKTVANFAVTTKPQTVTMTKTLPVTITVLVASGQTMDNVTIYPMCELGETATEYEAYKEPQEYTYAGTLGTNNTFTVPTGTFDSVYPTMTMTVTNDNSGTVEGSLTVQYNRDINAAFAELSAAIAAQA